jgi:hypothetical protein
MITKDIILRLAKQRKKIIVADLVTNFSVSRQYVNRLIRGLVKDGLLMKFGAARSTFYMSPQYGQVYARELHPKYTKIFKRVGLEEHLVLNQIEHSFLPLEKISENVKSIFSYAFSEMLNNAIEHSNSATVRIQDGTLLFNVDDFGVGVFRNVMKKRNLKSEFEAMQDILKGKTTTMPRSHSGEGIFFTSKVCELFILDSFGYQLIVDNRIPDVFIKQVKKIKKGTRVTFQLNTATQMYLGDVFNEYANIAPDSDYGFDKTEIYVKLYTIAGVHISRSQARRILSGLEKFKIIILDFDKVQVVGQAFADEIFRVFHHKYPDIKIEAKNMNKSVEFMVERAKHEGRKNQG